MFFLFQQSLVRVEIKFESNLKKQDKVLGLLDEVKDPTNPSKQKAD